MAAKYDLVTLVLLLLVGAALVACGALFWVLVETLAPGPAAMPAYIQTAAAA